MSSAKKISYSRLDRNAQVCGESNAFEFNHTIENVKATRK